MKKTICIVSNVILSGFYVSTSWMVSAAALFYLLGLSWDWSSLPQVLWAVATALIVLTPIFCAFGIVFSILRWRKERYLGAFLIQFLPFATCALSVLLFLVPVYLNL